MEFDTNDMNLRLVHCLKFDGYSLPKNTKLNTREVYDYEFEYFTQSDGYIIINGKKISFKNGDVNFRKPGQIVRGVIPYNSFCISVDLSNNKDKILNYYGFGNPKQAQKLYDNFAQIPDKIVGEAARKMGIIIKNIYEYYCLNNYLMIKSELYRLFEEIQRLNKGTEADMLLYNNSIKIAVRYLNNNYTDEINFNELSKIAGLSKTYFFKVFKQCTGTTPNKFLLNLRISKARYLLSTTNLSISDIGYECGFLDNVYFSYVFKRETGLTPKEYKNTNLK